MLHSINTIRTLSCISIAIFHITEFVNASSDTITLPFTAAPGFHLFLLISGFILVYITNPDDQPVPFMMKRAVRILPLYWLMTAVAILMIADAIESATRSMSEPTPSRIESLVHTIAKKRLEDGQFDECGLTLKDLHTIEESVAKSVTAIYHGRISYPGSGTGTSGR